MVFCTSCSSYVLGTCPCRQSVPLAPGIVNAISGVCPAVEVGDLKVGVVWVCLIDALCQTRKCVWSRYSSYFFTSISNNNHIKILKKLPNTWSLHSHFLKSHYNSKDDM